MSKCFRLSEAEEKRIQGLLEVSGPQLLYDAVCSRVVR